MQKHDLHELPRVQWSVNSQEITHNPRWIFSNRMWPLRWITRTWNNKNRL